MTRWSSSVLVLVGVLGCSSSESTPTTSSSSTSSTSSSSSGGTSTVACRQKDGADTDDDCAGKTGTPRKLDCSLASETQEAVNAGCVLEKAGGTDVCCPTTVTGTAEKTVSGCTEPTDTLTDSDCAGTPEARKLSCTTSTAQKSGLALGCRAEDPGESTDFDLCCPTNVRGQ
jgi:hypothetical protein